MAIATQVTMLMVNLMAKGNINGVQGKDTWVTFTKASSMAKASGRALDRLSIATCTKEIINMIKSMERVCSLGLVATSTRVITIKTRGMATVRCCGLMEACMKVNGKKEFRMVLEEWFLPMEQSKKAILKTMCISMSWVEKALSPLVS